MSGTERILRRFAVVVCPPELGTAGARLDGLVEEFTLLMGSLPVATRRAVPVVLTLFDQAARCYPPARGRRFARLGDQLADTYLRAVSARSGLGTAVRRIKGMVVMCYYELPEVQEQLGYRPAAYIAEVTRRRLATYGEQIRAGEAAVFTDQEKA